MIPALIILSVVALVGLLLFITHRLYYSSKNDNDEATQRLSATHNTSASSSENSNNEQCCGMHITCERDSLLTAIDNEQEYFDDEELDQYIGIPADNYDAQQTEQFTDILLTLRPEDIAPWARAIQRRGITLPTAVRDQLLMIVAEERQKQTQ